MLKPLPFMSIPNLRALSALSWPMMPSTGPSSSLVLQLAASGAQSRLSLSGESSFTGIDLRLWGSRISAFANDVSRIQLGRNADIPSSPVRTIGVSYGALGCRNSRWGHSRHLGVLLAGE